MTTKPTEGTEAIAFQKNSKLASDLVTLFDRMFHQIGQYDKKNPDAKKQKRMTDLFRYFKKNTADGMTKIIEKHTNVVVSKVVLSHPMEPTAMFAIDLSMNDIEGTGAIYDTLTGAASMDTLSDEEKTHEFFRLVDAFDEKSGKLKLNKIPKGVKVQAEIYFDFSTAFLANDLLPNVQSLTSEEITAIMLHEVGHMMTLIEHSGNMAYVGQETAKAIVALSKNGDPLTVIKGINENLKAASDKISKSHSISKKLVKGFNGACDVVIDAASKVKAKPTKGVFLTMLQFILTNLLYAFIMANNIIFFMLLSSITFTYNKISVGERGKRDTGKSSDDTYTERNLSYFERIADEYVARHGMGSHLATGLQKIIKFMNTISGTLGTTALNRNVHNSTVVRVYLEITRYIFTVFNMNLNNATMLYEADLKRIEQVLQANMAIFKNPNLPVEVRNKYIAETKHLLKAVEAEKKNYAPLIEEFVWTYVIPLQLPGVLYETLRTGRLNTQMKTMLDKLDQLTNNKLYFQSAQFKQLMDKFS